MNVSKNKRSFNGYYLSNLMAPHWIRHIRIKMDESKTGEDIYIKGHIFAGDAVENDIIIEQKAE